MYICNHHRQTEVCNKTRESPCRCVATIRSRCCAAARNWCWLRLRLWTGRLNLSHAQIKSSVPPHIMRSHDRTSHSLEGKVLAW